MMIRMQQPLAATRLMPTVPAGSAAPPEAAPLKAQASPHSQTPALHFEGKKLGFWGKAWLLTPLLGLGSWLGGSHLETRPVAHARVAMDKHSEELLALDKLRQKEDNPVARINYELLVQKEIMKYVSVIGGNVSKHSGNPAGNPVDTTWLGQIGLGLDEIRFTRSVLEDVSKYQGAENAEKLYMAWADRVLAKRVDAPTLEKRKSEAKSFFSSMNLNKNATEVLWVAMLASFTSFGLITIGGTLKGLFGGDDDKPKK